MPLWSLLQKITRNTKHHWKQWREQSKLLASRREGSNLSGNQQRRQQGEATPPLEVSKSLIDTDQEQWRFGRYESGRSRPTCSSGSFPSSDWSGKSPMISKKILGCRALRCWRCRNQRKRIWWGCTKTATCAPFTESG